MLHGPREAIEPPDENAVEPLFLPVRHQAIEFRPPFLRARPAAVGVFVHDFPLALFAVGAEGLQLGFHVLAVLACGDPGIEGDAHSTANRQTEDVRVRVWIGAGIFVKNSRTTRSGGQLVLTKPEPSIRIGRTKGPRKLLLDNVPDNVPDNLPDLLEFFRVQRHIYFRAGLVNLDYMEIAIKTHSSEGDHIPINFSVDIRPGILASSRCIVALQPRCGKRQNAKQDRRDQGQPIGPC